jgi:hypothetical protein
MAEKPSPAAFIHQLRIRDCLKSMPCAKPAAIERLIRAAKRAQEATHVAVHGAVLRAPWEFSDSLLETVWKIRMGSALRSQESQKPGERHPYRRLVLPKARDPSPSSYFPNSFGSGILGSSRQAFAGGTMMRASTLTYTGQGKDDEIQSSHWHMETRILGKTDTCSWPSWILTA